LEIALERVTNTKTSAADRVMWSRIVIAGGQACNSVLRDAEIWLLLRAEERYVDKSLVQRQDHVGSYKGHWLNAASSSERSFALRPFDKCLKEF
jgi:metal-dependent amidase/aminoacylase/carboxypeptidase family protein